MLIDGNGQNQPAVGTQDHWNMFREVSREADIFNPLRDEVDKVVQAAITANPTQPFLDARQGGATALAALSSWWHGEFPRRFARFPNGSDRAVFGMALWNHLASLPEKWSFADVPDSHGFGQSAKQYWRLSSAVADNSKH